MKRGPGRRKGQVANCIRCGRPFIRNHEDHIICKPGCPGEGREELSEPHPQGSGATIPPSSSSPGLYIGWYQIGVFLDSSDQLELPVKAKQLIKSIEHVEDVTYTGPDGWCVVLRFEHPEQLKEVHNIMDQLRVILDIQEASDG